MQHLFRISPAMPKRKSWFSLFLGNWLKNLNITGYLIIINIAVYIIEIFMGYNANGCSNNICNYLAIQPHNLFVNNYYWTLITSIFSHGNILHLFVNMVSLYFVGNFLETIIGKRRFFWLYMLSGIFAGLFFALLAFYFGNSYWGIRIFGSVMTFGVGASGSIFALAGTLALLTPRMKVSLIAGPIVGIILESILGIFVKSAAIFNVVDFLLSAYILFCIFSMFSFNPFLRKLVLPIRMSFWVLPIAAIIPLVVLGLFLPLPIGNMAHLGGLIAGALYGLYLKLRYKNKTQLISNYFAR
jgi:membrane associated rhomboid family serine protease